MEKLLSILQQIKKVVIDIFERVLNQFDEERLYEKRRLGIQRSLDMMNGEFAGICTWKILDRDLYWREATIVMEDAASNAPTYIIHPSVNKIWLLTVKKQVKRYLFRERVLRESHRLD